MLEAAAELGYHRNALAMGMFHRRSGIFGVITGRLDNPLIASGRQRQEVVAAYTVDVDLAG